MIKNINDRKIQFSNKYKLQKILSLVREMQIHVVVELNVFT